MQRSNFEKNDRLFQIKTPMCRGAESRQPTIKPHQNAHFPLVELFFISFENTVAPYFVAVSFVIDRQLSPHAVTCALPSRAVFVMRVIDYGNLERPREMVRDGEQNLRPAVSDEPLVA